MLPWLLCNCPNKRTDFPSYCQNIFFNVTIVTLGTLREVWKMSLHILPRTFRGKVYILAIKMYVLGKNMWLKSWCYCVPP